MLCTESPSSGLNGVLWLRWKYAGDSGPWRGHEIPPAAGYVHTAVARPLFMGRPCRPTGRQISRQAGQQREGDLRAA